MVVQRRWNRDDAGHERLSSPRRWAASPVAPRCPTFRAAATLAAFLASDNLSPPTIREKWVAPQTSPHPVGSPHPLTSGALPSRMRISPNAPVLPRGPV